MSFKYRALPFVFAAAAAASPASAASASLWVQAPFDVKTGAMDLDNLEYVNWQPAFNMPLFIPYDQLEPLIRQQIKAVADGTKSGTAVCTDPCPDVPWSVTTVADFAFTQKNQPTLTSLGNASENRVRIDLNAQARVKLNVHAYADLPGSDADVDVPVEVLIGIQATSTVKLWPNIAHEGLDIDLTLDGSNIEIQGLNGDAIAIGAELGAIVGSTPLGIALGGPFLAIVGAILGNEGAEIAKDKIKQAISARLDDALTQAEQQIEGALNPILGAAAVQADQVKSDLLSQPLPGINQSFNQLSSAFGLSLDVRTHVGASSTLRTVATTRFSGAAGSSTLTGNLRIPKTKCEYMVMSSKYTGTVYIPTAVVSVNGDLTAKIGQSCSSLFGGTDLKRSAYLGESPEKRLLSGNAANQLSSWTATGIASYPGSLSQTSDYYRCSFQVGALSNAGILELEAPPTSNLGKRLGEQFGYSERFMVVQLGGTTLVFNSELAPVSGGTGAVIGGAGPKTLADCPVRAAGGGQPLERSPYYDLKWRFDPETCPQCGVRRVLDRSSVVYEITNVDAFLQTPLGTQVKAQFGNVAVGR
ncbi:MAG TPA: hypothetical protein VK524_34010 [Polyangiaceae bacterium]|nr:hypothetical protein [Polyangiaceae bacterium]